MPHGHGQCDGRIRSADAAPLARARRAGSARQGRMPGAKRGRPGAAERHRLINYGLIRQFAYPLHVKVRRASMATWVRLPGGLDVV